jgi:hypothetical protein
VRFPEAWTDRLPFLEQLEEDWEPLPRPLLATWVIFYVLFLYQAARGTGILLLMDVVFVSIHEGGHLLFQFFGEFIGVAGGAILQLLVPILLAAYFLFQRQAQGVAFCLFFFFEQFLPISTYMADARAMELPLVSVGGGDDVIHDWNYLFGKMDLLARDTQIAGVVLFIGWLGMLGVVAWLVWRGLNDIPMQPQVTTDEGR